MTFGTGGPGCNSIPARRQDEFPNGGSTIILPEKLARLPQTDPRIGATLSDEAELQKVPPRKRGSSHGQTGGCRGRRKSGHSRAKLGTPVAMPKLQSALAPVALWASPAKSEDPFMIATVPVTARHETSRASLDYLLLGDLRLLLEEPASVHRDRWLVATLDMLLMSRPRSGLAIYRSTLSDEPGRGPSSRQFVFGGLVPYDKLQRLRDRIVHRAPNESSIQELKDDLCEWAESLRVLAPLSSCTGDE
jgi:hypothetical protein